MELKRRTLNMGEIWKKRTIRGKGWVTHELEGKRSRVEGYFSPFKYLWSCRKKKEM